MPHWFSPRVIAAIFAGSSLLACGRSSPAPAAIQTASSAGDLGLILGADEGERRVRRNAGKGPFILKVDRQNGGSPDLVMGYEDIAPGAEIQPHTIWWLMKSSSFTAAPAWRGSANANLQ